MRERFQLLLGALVLFTTASCTAVEPVAVSGPITQISTPQSQRPNVIFILVDDMGWGDVGYHGSEIATPNIDALAASGITLDRAYASPICSPTRAGLMTGRNPLQYGIDGPMENDAQLPAGVRLCPNIFAMPGTKPGWSANGIWEWPMWRLCRNRAGFESFYGHLGGFIDFYTHTYFGGLDWQRDGKSLREDGYSTDLLTAEASRLIKAYDGESPFFLYLSYNAPHTPLQYPPQGGNDYSEITDPDRRVYAQMLTYLDTSIGTLMKQLQQQGLTENTLIVFMSDNGGLLEAGSSNGALRGGKGSAYEGGIRVPAFISWRGKIAPAQTSATPIFTFDWLPTLLDASGTPYDAGKFDGLSNWSVVANGGAAPVREPVLIGTAGSKAAFQWPYKFVRTIKRGTINATDQLFDVSIDPNESKDIAIDHSSLMRNLAARIDALPKLPSKAATGPSPESQFRDAKGKFVHDIRLPETRAPWAEQAKGAVTPRAKIQ